MADFFYQAKPNPQNTIEGVIEAPCIEAAVEKLINLGLTPVIIRLQNPSLKKARPQSPAPNTPKARCRVPLRKILIFTCQLHNLIKSGLPVITVLNLLYRQEADAVLKGVIQELASEVKDGQSLSQSLSRHPKIFSNIYVGIVASGEAAGRLDEALMQIDLYLKKIEDTRLKVLQALAYPFLMTGVGFISIFILVAFVIPRLAQVFNDLDAPLPVFTRMLLGAGDFFRAWWWLVFILLFLSGSILLQKREWLRQLPYRMPLIKNLLYKQSLVNFANTLGLLLKSGVSLFESLRLILPLIEEKGLRQNMESVREKVKAGAAFSDSLESFRSLPVFAINLVRVGEESGRLDEALADISAAYTEELDSQLKIISSLIEPLIILVFGAIIGSMVIAILLPVFQISIQIK